MSENFFYHMYVMLASTVARIVFWSVNLWKGWIKGRQALS